MEWWVRQDKNQYRGKMVPFLNRKIILEERFNTYENMEKFFDKCAEILGGSDSEDFRAVSYMYVPEDQDVYQI